MAQIGRTKFGEIFMLWQAELGQEFSWSISPLTWALKRIKYLLLFQITFNF